MRKVSIFLFSFFCCIVFLLTACSNLEDANNHTQKPIKNIEETDSVSPIIKGITYHILQDEYLVTNDENNPNVNALYREYKVYDGNKQSKSDLVASVTIPKEYDNITDAKKYLQENSPEWLQLEPLTIISQKVLDNWYIEKYQGEFEYWSESPKGLTLEQIIQEYK